MIYYATLDQRYDNYENQFFKRFKFTNINECIWVFNAETLKIDELGGIHVFFSLTQIIERLILHLQ